jgi:uncharacterized protein YcbK (DUF882 family)
MGDITKNFSWSEFACNCGCGESYMDVAFVNKLQRVRDITDIPMIITSGYRCKEYNRLVGGVDNSAHTKGIAVDISCETSYYRLLLIEALLSCGINRIGIGSDFVHCDVDKTKPDNVMWLYD